ncbi:MAG: hypothetical protein JW729_10660 [Bacteroidales bacterium]|nr:hypothetical protein [Bacteroidales bacterium]
MFKILVVHYSQSGQLTDILSNFLETFKKKPHEYQLFYHTIKTEPEFAFPWTSARFYDAFPESVMESRVKINSIPKELIQKYDLIILGYQVWYLSLSIPISSFVQSEDFKKIAKDTAVFSVNACRNMWYMAYDRLNFHIEKAGAKHLGHLVLYDKTQNLISVFTIIYWMLGGIKDRYLGIFPKPGVSDEDIKSSANYGELLEKHVRSNQLSQVQTEMVKAGSVHVLPHMMSMEKKAKRIFQIWAKFVLKKGGPSNPNRAFRLKLFKYYLLFMIYFVSTIAMLLFYLFYPINARKIRKNIRHFQGLD